MISALLALRGRLICPFSHRGQANNDSGKGKRNMKFVRVIGARVATRKYEGLEGVKFLVVRP